MLKILMTDNAIATTDTLAATINTMVDACSFELGVTKLVGATKLVDIGMVELVEGRAHTGSLISLILIGQSGSIVTTATPLVIVAPCLTQSSI